MFRSFHLIIGFKVLAIIYNDTVMYLKLGVKFLLEGFHEIFDVSRWPLYPAVGFKKMMLTAHPGTCPGCSSLLWSSEQTLARSRQVTLDNSCNSSLGPFSPSISELQPTFKCFMLCKQIFSHFLLVHIKARSYDSVAARDLVVWVVTLRTSYNLSPLGIRMHRLVLIIMLVRRRPLVLW